MELVVACPNCGTNNNMHTSVLDAANVLPNDGDVSACARCHAFSVFVVNNGHVSLRLPESEQESREIRSFVMEMTGGL